MRCRGDVAIGIRILPFLLLPSCLSFLNEICFPRASFTRSQHWAYPARYSWINEIAMLPSPTLLATRLIDPLRTSPAQKMPGKLVSSGNGGRRSRLGRSECPVQIKPFWSRCKPEGNQPVFAVAPIMMNRASAGYTRSIRVAPGGERQT